MKKSVAINSTLLSPSLQARFGTMLQVAGHRSIVEWVVSEDPTAADVVLKEHPEAGDKHMVPIYVADAHPATAEIHCLYLPVDFRVKGLMDALDLAAVRVMNRWEAMARATPLTRAIASGGPAQRYQLRHWVFLGANRSGMRYTRTLAVMSQRPVTRDWIISRGGLSAAEADSLLADLQLRGALQTTSDQPSASTRAGADQHAGDDGFVGRLKRWLSGSRPRTVADAA